LRCVHERQIPLRRQARRAAGAEIAMITPRVDQRL
jgi:hypothetical protein